MSGIKSAKKGDFLFREGDKITHLIFVKTGTVHLVVTRPKKNVEISHLGSNQVLGEMGIMGAGQHGFSAVANSEVQYMEIPIELVRKQVEASSEMFRVLVRSLSDRVKVSLGEIKSSRLEKDSTPCPESETAAIFGAIFHSARHKGERPDPKKPELVQIDWNLLKQYSQRIFRESPRRLEQATNLLVKMKEASYVMGKPVDDPEGPDEIKEVTFTNLPRLESFIEFFQYHYYKGSTPGILKFEESAFNLVNTLLLLTKDVEVDRFGVISLDYGKVIEGIKTHLNINLNSNHFNVLEQKGVMTKRVTRTDGSVVLQFEKKELETTLVIWRILQEIDKWNQKGFVDPKEEEVKKKVNPGAPSCGQCGVEVATTAKFCHECGAKISAPAAAA